MPDEKNLPEGWFSEEDIKTYRKLMEAVPDKGAVIELGAWKGRSLCSVADLIVAKDLDVTAVDTFEGTENEGEAHKEAKVASIYDQFNDNLWSFGIWENVDIIKAKTQDVCQTAENNSFDLVFVDADHSTEAVRADIIAYWPLLKAGGVMAGHDWAWPSVKAALHSLGLRVETEEGSNVWHVRKPGIAAFCITYNEEWIIERFVRENLENGVDEVYVLDNGSTDMTVELAERAGAIVKQSGCKHTYEDYDEAKPKQLAMAWTKEMTKCDWLLYLDADEILEKRSTSFLLKYTTAKEYDAYSMRLPTFWLSDEYYRTDGDFGAYYLRMSSLKLFRKNSEVVIPDCPRGAHTGPRIPAGAAVRMKKIGLRLKHLGYTLRERVQQKYDYYRKADPAGVMSVNVPHYEHLNPDYPDAKLEKWSDDVPAWSFCFIGKNEANFLPTALKSLKEFMDRGGEVCYLDTGSTDNTAQIAREAGCVVEEVGEKFLITLTKEEADSINAMFIVDDEEPIVKEGGKLFHFAAARNYCAENLASNDIIAMLDCDEGITKLDIDILNRHIADGIGQFEYEFVFSHDGTGKPVLQFVQSKMYDKNYLEWVGIVHECLFGKKDAPAGVEIKRQYIPENIYKNEHWQNPSQDRSGYLRGLALDCWKNPTNDRNSHYTGRELLWNNRPTSAIREFKRHLEISWWKPERGQSMIFIGDALNRLGNSDEAIDWFHKSIKEEAGRREAFIKLMQYYFWKSDWQRVVIYGEACLTIPWSGYYANDKYHYTHYPHQLLAEAWWFLGRKDKSKEHFDKALEYAPLESKFLYDYRYHYPLPRISILIPTLGRPEGLQKCKDSIEKLTYDLKGSIEVLSEEDEPRMGVAKRLNGLVAKSTGEYLVYASNDIEFTPDSLMLAYLKMKREDLDLVAFNTGELLPDEGNICEHFMITKKFVDEKLGGKIFCEDMNHVGVDNLLWAQAKKYGKAERCVEAVVIHNHFTRGANFDSTYALGWDEEKVKQDREKLKVKLDNL